MDGLMGQTLVPDELVAEVLATERVHPWSINQRGDKWRLCHDYSVGTNLVAKSGPFSLPTPWDVRATVKPDTHFAKYDLRDGFWNCTIAWSDRRKLLTRHPATQRLMWCRSPD